MRGEFGFLFFLGVGGVKFFADVAGFVRVGRHEVVETRDDEEGEEGGNGDAADDDDGHGDADFGSGADAERGDNGGGDGGGGGHDDGAKADGASDEDGFAAGLAILVALLVEEFDEEDGILQGDAHEDDDADEAVKVERVVGDEEGEEGTGEREGKRDHHGDGMDEAVELDGENHVGNDEAEDEGEDEILEGLDDVLGGTDLGEAVAVGEGVLGGLARELHGLVEGDARGGVGVNVDGTLPHLTSDGEEVLFGGNLGDGGERDEFAVAGPDEELVDVGGGLPLVGLEADADVVAANAVGEVTLADAANGRVDGVGDVLDADTAGGGLVAVGHDMDLGEAVAEIGVDVGHELAVLVLLGELFDLFLEDAVVRAADAELETVATLGTAEVAGGVDEERFEILGNVFF